MKHLISIIMILLLLTIVFSVEGCFKQAVEVREPLPDIIWPKPPEIPRIRFVNSISRAKDLNIKEGVFKRFFTYLKGTSEMAIVSPYGVETDIDGRLYVVDTFNRYVHVFDVKNNACYTFPENEHLFGYPVDIAIDKKGNIYVSDSKEGIVKVFKNYGREYVREIGRGILERPTGVAINEKTGELLVVDTLNFNVIRYDLNDYHLKGIVGRSGSETEMFHYPTNIFVSRDGLIFVSDSLNFRVQIFTPDGKFLRAFGTAGDSPGYFSRPKGVAVDSHGNIYVVDALFDNIQIFDKEGRLLMAFGGPGHGYGEFWLPSGIFIDSNDRIYVSDSYNKRVQVFQYMKREDL